MLAENIVHFSRILRDAGLAVGPDRVLDAIAAVEAVGLDRRADVHAALAAVMLDRHEQQVIFDAAFETFFRDPKLLEQMMYLLLPKVSGRGEKHQPKRANRLAEALAAPRVPEPPNPANQTAKEEHQFDAAFTFSERERLQRADFETMTAAEWQAAKRALAAWRWQLQPVATRRLAPTNRPGRIDLRATLRAAARQGGEFTTLHWRQPRKVLPPWVVIADISGSMSRYSRMLLHFAHALHGAHGHTARVHSFVFGTRLTPITLALRERDPDEAVAAAVQAAPDWSGGTRLTDCLHAFNRDWARRTLGGRATLLLITDGLAHGDTERLGAEMARLHGRCTRLIWLNPLLRFDGFEPRAAGIRAMLPHVDEFIPAHNLASLAELAQRLARHTADRR